MDSLARAWRCESTLLGLLYCLGRLGRGALLRKI